MSSALPARGRYEGLLQILRYNGRFFLLSAVAAALALVAALSQPMPGWAALGLLGFGVAVVAGSMSSLLASHYVYDLSELHRWEWLRSRIPPPASCVVFHAGLDEATPALRVLYPNTEIRVLDFYDPGEMTEPSIAEARARDGAPGEAARFDALPVTDAAAELVVLFFVAHELRRPDARERFFVELRRCLKPGGSVVLVEHLRDWPNALAFGPGALHFLPRAEWLRLAVGARLRVREELRITPFVRAFFLCA